MNTRSTSRGLAAPSHRLHHLILGLAFSGCGAVPEANEPDRGVRGDDAGKSDHLGGSCVSEAACGGQSESGSCWCDGECGKFGDCCADAGAVCGVDTCIPDRGPACPGVTTCRERDGERFECVALESCAAIKAAHADAVDGVYTIEPTGSEAFEVYCDMTTDGGGWTLVLVASDDDTNTWTWENRALLTTDTTTLGSLDDLDKDYKSRAWHALPFRDVMFEHAPSGVWAAYGGVGTASSDLATFIGEQPFPNCEPQAYPMTAGTLAAGGKLCDTDLYFNLGDREGGKRDLAYCKNLSATWNDSAPGPVWDTGNNAGCGFDDPSTGGLGFLNPSCSQCTHDTSRGTTEVPSLGFGGPLGLNSAPAGLGGNALRMFVR